MVETEVLSPDSGLGGPSPCASVSVEFALEDRPASEKTGKEQLITSDFEKMYTEPPTREEYGQNVNSKIYPKFGSLKNASRNGNNSVLNRFTDCQKVAQTLDERQRNTKRRRRGGKDATVDADEKSPVLGIKILPATTIKNFNDIDFLRASCVDAVTESKGFICRLCFQPHEDALSLAAHKCARIVNERYVCPECDKVFGCPANLASHRRWHKPKDMQIKTTMESKLIDADDDESAAAGTSRKVEKEKLSVDAKKMESEEKLKSELGQRLETQSPKQTFQKAIFPCPYCKRRFRRNSNRRKHAQIKHGMNIAQTEEKKSLKKVEGKKLPSLHSNTVTQKVDDPCSSTQIRSSNSQFCSKEPGTAFRSPLISSLSWPQHSKTTVYSSPLSFEPPTQDVKISLDLDQPLDLSMKKPREERLNHSIDEIMKNENQSTARRHCLPYQPILQFPLPPVLHRVNPSACYATVSVRPNTVVPETFTGGFCTPNPYFSYSYQGTHAPSRPRR